MIRVTEVLDYFTEQELLKWIENNSKAKRKAISDEALRIGTTVDLLIQNEFKESIVKPIILDNDKFKVENCMKAWKQFKKDYLMSLKSIVDIQTELISCDVMGHPDLISDTGQIWGIIDIKTSSAIRHRYWTQCAAYCWLRMMSQSFKFPDFIGIIRLDKLTGNYEYKEIREPNYIQYEIDTFQAYLKCYQHAEKNREQLRLQLEKEMLNVS